MEERKLHNKKELKEKITLQELQEKFYNICYPENDNWYNNWTKQHGKSPSDMQCRRHEDEKYSRYQIMLNTELKKHPQLRKEYDLLVAEHKLDSEMGFLTYYGMTDEQIANDSRIKKLKKELKKVKSKAYTKEDMQK